MTKKHNFVTYLEGLRDEDDRGALAALRRGLGRSPGTSPEMFPYVVSQFGRTVSPWEQDTAYLVASLFALHSESTEAGNLGNHFARARALTGGDGTAIERRFTALLSAHEDDLPFYLRQAVSFLRSKKVEINWHQLMRDLSSWDHPDSYVQREWARAFWAKQSKSQDDNDNNE